MASRGDPRVLFLLNLTLSAVFGTVVISGLAFINAMAFSWTAVALATVLLMLLTWFVVLRGG